MGSGVLTPPFSEKPLQRTQQGVPERLVFSRSAEGDIMRALTIIMRGLALMIIAMLVVPPGIPAQDNGQPPVQTYRFSEAELAQMLAPIALYPDSLIAQILMASTYPLELVEAERWLRQNQALQGDQLDTALQQQTWDSSIKSLCHFPDVLFSLSDKLDQTRKLGDAFLSQQDDVMNEIQTLRLKAQEQGNLRTTKEQKVIVEQDTISIAPTDPYEVYVPQYNPLYVYGPWAYPAYPPWYWYYPAGLVSGPYITFGYPFAIGFDLFFWPWVDWGGHHFFGDFDFDRDRHHHHDDWSSGHHDWQHDPSHRGGVAYRDGATTQRFRPSISPIPRSGAATRGYPSSNIQPIPRSGAQRQGVSPRTSTGGQRQNLSPVPSSRVQRQGVSPRTSTGVPRQNLSPVPSSGVQRQGISPRTSSGVQRQSNFTPSSRVSGQSRMAAPARDNTFHGIGNGSFERRASQRGGISRQGIRPQSRGMGGSRSGSGNRGFRR